MDATKMERVKAQFGEGREATCLVNPRHPSEAVLERGDLWGVLFLLGPVLIIGLMGHEEILPGSRTAVSGAGWLLTHRFQI